MNINKPLPIMASAPYELRTLDTLFSPKTIAVIGATEKGNPEGRQVLSNLVNHPFGGTVYPINAQASSVLGIKAYPNLAALPEKIDLAVIATPARQAPKIIGECMEAGVHGAIILSPGFRETGAAGAELERQVFEQAHRGQIRIIGPNSLGIMYPPSGLNATYARTMARRGHVAFLSQSGALGASVLDWSQREQVGLSAFVSVGSMLDVSWGDLIYYFGDDPHTRCILIYMESIGDARALVSAAREVSLQKPIIVLKAGQTEEGQRAAISHTGAMTGSLQVLDAAFRRTGVLRVNTLGELFYMAETLDRQPRPRGPRLTILTNAGGPALMAVDELIAHGGELSELAPATLQALDQFLPAHWNHGNPIDILDEADPERYARAVEIAVQDPNSNGLLIILTPQALTDSSKTAQALKPYMAKAGKPILASWMGGVEAEAGIQVLNRANIPTFSYPDTAARVFAYMWRLTYNLRGIYETPSLPIDETHATDRSRAGELIQAARAAGRTLLSEYESKQVLAAYGLPVVETHLATGEDKAVQIAEQLGYPVVLKVHSYTITHKTEVGGVQLDLPNAASVRRAYQTIQARAGQDFLGVMVQRMIGGHVHSPMRGHELIVGSTVDPQFGPVLLFGAGGLQAEGTADYALALPPLNTTLARRMMEQTRIDQALQGVRGAPAGDIAAVEQFLVRFSQLVLEQPWIREIDINPLLVNLAPPPTPEKGQESSSLLALDARMILYGVEVRAEQLPRPAIRPYPSQYIYEWTTKKEAHLLIRPIRPEDEPLMVSFHSTLSERSVYLRYLRPILLDQRVAHDRLARVCFIDYDREMALVAERPNPETGQSEIVGIGRLSKLHRRNDGEFAVLVSDHFQGHGLGTELLRKLVDIGRDEKLDHVIGFISGENDSMIAVSKKLGFRIKRGLDDSEVEAIIDVKETAS
ncbi:MAG: bifunctional acetate--CoA ligase family protein/GNAT family N-acetyltransferase [Anaerolineae bacterium]